MAGNAHQELRENLGASGDGDDTRINGKRVNSPVWFFVAVILGAVEVGRVETEISHLIRDRDNDKAAVVSFRHEDAEASHQALVAGLAEQRRSVDQDIQRLGRQLDDEKERNQALREFLIRKRIL